LESVVRHAEHIASAIEGPVHFAEISEGEPHVPGESDVEGRDVLETLVVSVGVASIDLVGRSEDGNEKDISPGRAFYASVDNDTGRGTTSGAAAAGSASPRIARAETEIQG
jgi:hypothetical protein